MFRKVIKTTPLTTEVANNFFQRIGGNAFYDDITFVATLRALVAPRMKEDEQVSVVFNQTNYTADQLAHYDDSRAVRAVSNLNTSAQGEIRIHNFTNTHENNHAWMELMQRAFESVYPGWHMLDKVTAFFKKQFYVLCFVNPETKSVMIFTDSMDICKMHYLQCGIFAFLPWYFNPEEALGEIEMALIYSLRETSSQKYEDCLARIADKYDFKAMKIRQLLAGFETKYEQRECTRITNEIAQLIECIEDLNSQIGGCLKEKRDYENLLRGLETKLAQDTGDSEMMEYFLCNDRLVLESVTSTTMVFGVKDYLTYFDEDMAKAVIDNKASYIYRPRGQARNNYIPEEDMERLMTAIFIDQKLRLKMCAAYELRLNGNVRAIGEYDYGSDYSDCTPNTHIDRYRCLGSYSTQINKFLQKNDYIGAIEQCVASCKSLNLGDSAVMQEFMSRIYGCSDYEVNIRCIELPDGRVVHPKEAIEYLKQEEQANE